MKIVYCYLFAVVSVIGVLQESAQGRPLLTPEDRPDPKDAAPFARWLVAKSSWGVLNTISSEYGGSPFGNVASFSDGLPEKGKGIPYFYLTTLDPTASNALKDQRSSFTLSEYSINSCSTKDPESPTCAKITLVGKLVLVKDSKEAEFAKTALFAKHPEMEHWPKSHNFQFYKLDIQNIFLINWFGGPKPLTVEQYLNAKLNKFTSFAHSTA
ncbi:hypothetical protein ACS0TY_028920 [Phlomoides rotata]